MLSARTVRLWYVVHKWTSLICTLFMFSACLTGLPLIFGEEIFNLTHHHVHAATVPKGSPTASLDAMVEAGKAKYPGSKVIFMAWDDDEPRVFLDLSPVYDPKPEQVHVLAFDAHTGKLLEEQNLPTDWVDYAFKLHTELFAGLPGELLLGFMALLFAVSLISGAVVYGPFMRRLKFGTVRKNLGPRVHWFDLHNFIGIATLVWALVVGVTGAMNTISAPLFGLWRAQTLPALLAPYQGKPMPQRLSSLDAAVATTQRGLPHEKIVSVNFPNPVDSSPRHYVVWTRGTTPLTSQLFTPALVDAVSGQLTVAKGLPWYLRALEVSRPLHFGNYAGLPLKVIWALLDLMTLIVLASGVYLWLKRGAVPEEQDIAGIQPAGTDVAT